MSISYELSDIAQKLEIESKTLQDKSFKKPLNDLAEASQQISKSWSGSWLGYHSTVYYEGLVTPPRGARFSQEWGSKQDDLLGLGSVGHWIEFDFEEIVNEIERVAGHPDISQQEEKSLTVSESFETYKSQVMSLLSTVLHRRKDDGILQAIVEKIKILEAYSVNDILKSIMPKGQFISRDMPALQAGLSPPPHIQIQATLMSIEAPFNDCKELSKLCNQAALHLENIKKHVSKPKLIGEKIFIGHGQSHVWRDLKDFVQDRLNLPWDEFNRVPVAGMTNITRLSQMLDESAIAFLIMTAEDEQADGTQHARQNVIHEAGLFQGRLGFQRAILLLEEGCEEFSNVQGLGQIRFPSGNISAAFEDIRRVLERENLVDE